jgi:2-amino-4-hydroxy-6-hydroxymethyldihydropteridine diphosphokinase
LGSNLGDREKTLESAIAELDGLPETKVISRSSWLENPAVGIEGGADFINGAVEIETRLPARELLDRLLEIERRYGRSRDTEQTGGGHRNRTLDLDLLLYGNEKIDQPGLVVPHPRIMEREFVLVPLAELGKVPPFFRSVEATASE